MKKIAIVAQGMSNGGAERVAINLANYFAEKFSVMFVAAYDSEKGYTLDCRVKIEIIETETKNKIARLIDRNKKICKVIKKFQPETVISFITNELLYTQLAGFKIIYSPRNDPSKLDRTMVEKCIRSFEYNRAYKIVFQTKGAKEFYSKKVQQRGVIIPNPMRCDGIPYWIENKHDSTFITACRLNEQKNLPMLIKAFAMFHQKHPKYRLDIYGRGELESELRELIGSLKCDEFISLKGYADNIYKIMSESYAFVLSSDYEGLSNSMLEALAVGIPCICTDCPPGGAREYIEDGVNGVLTPVGDIVSMSEKMEALANGMYNLDSLSRNAIGIRKIVDQDRICKMWEQII